MSITTNHTASCDSCGVTEEALDENTLPFKWSRIVIQRFPDLPGDITSRNVFELCPSCTNEVQSTIEDD